MTEHYFSSETIRCLEHRAIHDCGIHSLVLMENAGRGCVDLLEQQGVSAGAPVYVCCGKGNNGGDGFVIARHLDSRGIAVEVLIFDSPESLAEEAKANFLILKKTGICIHQISLPEDKELLAKHLSQASWIVDALLGIGTSGPPRGHLPDIISAINAAKIPVLAVDVPSGLNCDTGENADQCVVAKVTATFFGPKPGFQTPAAKAVTGEVCVVDLGIPQSVLGAVRGTEISGSS